MNSLPADSSASAPPGEWLLVVDDDQRVCDMATTALAGSPAEVVTATSGAEALKILATRANEPVLALIDVLMPVIDGLTLARRLRPRFKRGSIVLMSGYVTDRTLWPPELQDITFLAKPFRIATLRDIVQLARVAYEQRGSDPAGPR